MTTAQHRPVSVVIVGAGPTGVVAAHLLAQRGIDVLLLEREEAPYPLPRAVHFDDETFRVFQAIGLHQEIAARSRAMPGMQLVDRSLRPVFELPRRAEGGLHGLPESSFFDQPDLELVLRAGLAQRPGVTLLSRTEVEAIEQDRDDGPAPVRVTFRDRETGALSEVWTRAVLACDGARSRTRGFVGVEMEDLGFDETWLVVDVRSPAPFVAFTGTQQVCDPARPSTYMPVLEDRHRWEFMLMPGDVPAEMVRPERVRELVKPWLGDRDPSALAVIRAAVYTFRSLVARPWRRGRVFLLGDAAHQTPPFLGQGLCAGVRDAANLAWKLALHLHGDADARILDTYESERRPHARRVIRAAVMVGRSMTQGTPRRLAWQNRLVRAAGRLLGSDDLLVEHVFGRLGRGALVRPARRRGDLAGRFLPQGPVVTGDGKERLLDDVLGTGFVVLGDGDARLALPDAEERSFWKRLDTRFVRVVASEAEASAHASDEAVTLVDRSGRILAALTAGGAHAALVRPDRTILAAGPHPELARWRTMLREAGVGA